MPLAHAGDNQNLETFNELEANNADCQNEITCSACQQPINGLV